MINYVENEKFCVTVVSNPFVFAGAYAFTYIGLVPLLLFVLVHIDESE